MKSRAAVALFLVTTLLATAMPGTAHAEGPAPSPRTTSVTAGDAAVGATPDITSFSAATASASSDVLGFTSAVFAPKLPSMLDRAQVQLPMSGAGLGTDIMSRGAKTAIIVTAIVVGVLIIAGVIVVAKPFHHH